MGVDAIFVLYGGAADLPASVGALRQQGDAVKRIVAVDNASPDGAGSVAETLGVEVIRVGTNEGYAAAMNRAFRVTSHDYLLSLNADAVLHPGYVDKLVAALEADDTAAGATGVLVLPDETVDSSGIELTRAYWAADRDRGRAPEDVDTSAPFGVSGAAALLRRTALSELGDEPWWPWLFTYWDDVELAWRLRRRGWSFVVVPTATASHRRGSDTADPRRVEALSLRNRLATVARHGGRRGLLQPGSAAVTAVTVARLAVRHPAALRDAQPVAAIRAGLAARALDAAANVGGRDVSANRTRLAPHPWRLWLRRQLTGR